MGSSLGDFTMLAIETFELMVGIPNILVRALDVGSGLGETIVNEGLRIQKSVIKRSDVKEQTTRQLGK